MNFRKNDTDEIAKNKIFLMVKNAIGLHCDFGKPQKPLYHNIVIAADQDDDGIHICSLYLNLFDTFWPSLINNLNIKTLKTSVVRIYNSAQQIEREFFSF